ncbi:MAG: Spy/CpxP family protein refolding chaperone [Bdellovibrio sp.]
MRTRRKWSKALGILCAAAGIGAMTACHRSPEERIAAMTEKIADKLDFNEQQKALLNDIANEMKKDFAAEKETRLSMKNEFKSMILADELNKARIKEVIKERQDRMNTKVDKYVDKVAALHKTLTPEQKKELIDKIEKIQKRWE